jgi:hypothetical protein
MPALAADLVGRKVAVVLANAIPAPRVVMAATKTIPNRVHDHYRSCCRRPGRQSQPIGRQRHRRDWSPKRTCTKRTAIAAPSDPHGDEIRRTCEPRQPGYDAIRDRRWANRSPPPWPVLQPDIILTQSTPNTAALLQQTRTIPIVLTQGTDPVGAGFVLDPAS